LISHATFIANILKGASRRLISRSFSAAKPKGDAMGDAKKVFAEEQKSKDVDQTSLFKKLQDNEDCTDSEDELKEALEYFEVWPCGRDVLIKQMSGPEPAYENINTGFNVFEHKEPFQLYVRFDLVSFFINDCGSSITMLFYLKCN
jgi:hypothetical protein